MTLKLYFHPLSSFCHKALIALYETGAAFEPVLVNLGDPDSAAAFKAVWPIGRFPVVRDEASDLTLPESTIIIEYLATRFPDTGLMPSDPDEALHVKLWDRIYDLYLHVPMQRIVGDRLRPAESKDPFGVEQARELLRTGYSVAEREIAGKAWAAGDTFTMADCAAAPALFYGDKVEPLLPAWPNLAAYLERLKARPSYARVLAEAEPYFHMFPQET
ncbi:MAG: glutathione S-transferase family protein [Caulobacteraceae bacterium]